MAIDYGDQHTGLAVSDITETLVGNAWIVDEWNMERLADAWKVILAYLDPQR